MLYIIILHAIYLCTLQGVPTLWGSFEITNVKLIQKMIQQYHRVENLALLPPDKLEEVNSFMHNIIL
jgi:hypothetical protein